MRPENGPKGTTVKQAMPNLPLTERKELPLLILSTYVFLVAAWRLGELSPYLFEKSTVVGKVGKHLIVAVEETTMRAGYPSWTMKYLVVLVVVLSLLAGWSAYLSWGKTRGRTPASGVIIATAGLLVLLTIVHGIFLFKYDLAFGEGGLVPGILHVITLTRIDGYANAVGLSGYRIGQTIGLVATLAWPALLLSLRHARDPAPAQPSA